MQEVSFGGVLNSAVFHCIPETGIIILLTEENCIFLQYTLEAYHEHTKTESCRRFLSASLGTAVVSDSVALQSPPGSEFGDSVVV